MSLTRKASSAAKKPIKSPRQDLAAALAERDAELAEARSRQAATAEILRVISQSPADPQPVFESIVAAAARLLGCAMAAVLLRDGDAYVHTAGATPEGRMPGFAPIRVPIDASANFPSRAFLTKTMVHLPDWSLIDLPEHERHVRDAFGVNSALFLPLLRGDACIAVLVFIGKQANTFGPGEIAQAESFRDQALIAIENARLFREAQEALEQQKASAEVLGAISKSVADASPVFETILDACQRLFGSEELGIYTIGDDQMVRVAAWRGPRAEEARQDVTPLADSVTGRVIRERRPHHIPDLGAVPNLSPTLRDRVNRHGGASLLYAPMTAGRQRPRLNRRGPLAAEALLRPGTGAVADLRRSGGDRHRERAALPGNATRRSSGRPRPPTSSRSSPVRRPRYNRCSMRLRPAPTR